MTRRLFSILTFSIYSLWWPFEITKTQVFIAVKKMKLFKKIDRTLYYLWSLQLKHCEYQFDISLIACAIKWITFTESSIHKIRFGSLSLDIKIDRGKKKWNSGKLKRVRGYFETSVRRSLPVCPFVRMEWFLFIYEMADNDNNNKCWRVLVIIIIEKGK